ncbi:hypothetical protein SERLA73DRAFT_155171 [Serpula lacrymans var. lacrymans S7.3]|uniref:Uncharacterized protein n=2 Tax=Serpula lacrymans var. lacrymans TaxID=341189 RepID=F8Q8Q1_SERL3|nr:hypothetical protein SERLA73DRAFT_155171 [Serpula lacrymans var. lacrymans S7.3]
MPNVLPWASSKQGWTVVNRGSCSSIRTMFIRSVVGYNTLRGSHLQPHNKGVHEKYRSKKCTSRRPPSPDSESSVSDRRSKSYRQGKKRQTRFGKSELEDAKNVIHHLILLEKGMPSMNAKQDLAIDALQQIAIERGDDPDLINIQLLDIKAVTNAVSALRGIFRHNKTM